MSIVTEYAALSKLINRIPGSRLLMSSLPGSALRTHVESLGKPRDVNNVLKALPGKLDMKRHSSNILYISVLLSTGNDPNMKHVHFFAIVHVTAA